MRTTEPLRLQSIRPDWLPDRRNALILLALVAVALAVRLPFLDRSGLPSDIKLFVAWSETATNQGLPQLFARDDYNYPPLPAYLFRLIGHVQRDLLDRPFATDSATMRALLKLPAVLADLAITGVLYLFLIRRTTFTIAITGALAYGLNPAIVHNSVIWGQWDALVTLPMLLATVCLIASRPNLAAAFLAIAVLTKFQAVVLVPVAAIVILRQSGVCGLLRSSAIGAMTATVILLPLITAGQLRPVIDVYVGLTHTQPWVSNNAWNIWWLINWFQTGSPTMTLKDNQSLLGAITWKQIALTLYAFAVTALAVATYRARLTTKTISLAVAASVIAFFALAPEMHERYLLPAVPLLLLAFDNRLHRWLVAVVSLTLFFSLDWVLDSAEGTRWSTLKLASTGLLSVVNLGVLIAIGVVLVNRARGRPDRDRGVWIAGSTAMLLIVAFASLTVLRWYLNDVRN